jgi:esterase/lipase
MRKKCVLFVHGLGGGRKTWGKFEELLKKDQTINYIPEFYSYSTCIFRILHCIQPKYAKIETLSYALDTFIKNKLSDYDEIALVGHSLGGIIIKQYLINLKLSGATRDLDKIKKIIFYATPHDGALKANISSFFSFKHRHLRQLKNKSDYLLSLNMQWGQSRLDRILQCKNILAAEDGTVSFDSSTSGFKHLENQVISKKNHISIVKPIDEEDLSYLALRKFLCQENVITSDCPKCSLTFEELIEKEEDFEFYPDESRENIMNNLSQKLPEKRTVIRLTGLSGLGKTRVALEAFKKLPENKKNKILYLDLALDSNEIVSYVNKWVKEEYIGIVIADNCSLAHHDKLATLISSARSRISLLTIDTECDNSQGALLIQLKRLDNEQIKKILKNKFDDSLPDIDRIISFAQGFPQMAVLLAESILSSEPNLGRLSDDILAKKLLWGNSENENPEDEKILVTCALFDRFGLSENVSEEYEYIAENIAKIDKDTFHRCVKRFSQRGIIDLRGRYAQLVPKPLAIRLASTWWEETHADTQEKLINSIPDTMLESFCSQIKKLDFLPEVKEFTSKLCGEQGPFGRAEVILSPKGSQLFRALVEVNPEETSQVLYNLLVMLEVKKIYSIHDQVRRNLVWALEKLCFHKECFNESAWSLFLLALAENESWGNNATGQFKQLFRIWLSGTEADLTQRILLLEKVKLRNEPEAKKLVIEAIGNGLEAEGGYRTGGAEFQGTKPTLKEWQPKVWQEVFDYWQKCFEFLVELYDNNENLREDVKVTIGQNLSSLIKCGQIDILDNIINHIVTTEGHYWPSLVNSMKTTLQYNKDKLSTKSISFLENWLNSFQDVSLPLEERLKLYLINPGWEHKKDKNGEYINIAEKNARKLAKELLSNIMSIEPYLDILLVGEQQQTYSFGQEIGKSNKPITELLQKLIERIKIIESPNLNFLLGILNGFFQDSKELWLDYIEKFYKEDSLIQFYPMLIRTGEFNKKHLDLFLKHIKNGNLKSNSPFYLQSGSVTSHLAPKVISSFCIELASIDTAGAWCSLGIMYMYCFGKKGGFSDNAETLIKLIPQVNLDEDSNNNCGDIHHWQDSIMRLVGDYEQLADDVSLQIIKASRSKISYGIIWHSIIPILCQIFKLYGKRLWSSWGNEIINSEGNQVFWLAQILGKGTDITNKLSSLNCLPVDLLITWCKKNKDIGPQFIASNINILIKENDKRIPSSIFLAVLENFGKDKRVCACLSGNICSGTWTGSLIPYLEKDKETLSPLLNNSSINVQSWVSSHISYIDRKIIQEKTRDEERDFGIF